MAKLGVYTVRPDGSLVHEVPQLPADRTYVPVWPLSAGPVCSCHGDLAHCDLLHPTLPRVTRGGRVL